MQDEKYEVYKKEDMDGWRMAHPGHPFNYSAPRPLNDAVVIRTQDAFAAAGLSAYAHNIEFFLAQHPLEEIGYIPVVLNYFKAVTQEAEDRLSMGQCKLPD